MSNPMANSDKLSQGKKPQPTARVQNPAGKQSVPKEVMAIALRNEFYKDSYKMSRKIMLGLMSALILSVILNMVMFSAKPQTRIIAVDENGRVVPVRAMSDPMYKDSALNDWVASTVLELNTYDFRNWRKHFQEMEGVFTQTGWESYSRAMERSRNIELVESDQVLVSAITTGAPVVTDRGEFGGVYAWKVEFPIKVTYEGASDTRVQDLMMQVVVVRADLVTHDNGLAIEQIISREI